MSDNKQTINYHAFRNPAEAVIDSSLDRILDVSGNVVTQDKVFPKQQTHPAMTVDSSTRFTRVENVWHPGSIGDVSQGIVDAIFKAMPYKNKNLGWTE